MATIHSGSVDVWFVATEKRQTSYDSKPRVNRIFTEFQVGKRHLELSEKEIAWEVARLMYLSDEGTQRLLEQARAKLC